MISYSNKSVFNVSENSGSEPRKAQIGIFDSVQPLSCSPSQSEPGPGLWTCMPENPLYLNLPLDGLASRLTLLEPPASFNKRSCLRVITLLPSLGTLLLPTLTVNYSSLVAF